MSIYSPPTQNVAIFDTELFKTSDRFITQGECDKRYLRFPVAQSTETLQAIGVNGVATFNNTITQAGEFRIQQTDISNNTVINNFRASTIESGWGTSVTTATLQVADTSSGNNIRFHTNIQASNFGSINRTGDATIMNSGGNRRLNVTVFTGGVYTGLKVTGSDTSIGYGGSGANVNPVNAVICDASGVIISPSITFPNSTVQNSAFTGGTAGTYTNTNMTIDANGRISAISNGTVPSIPFAPKFANFSDYQVSGSHSSGTLVRWFGSWGKQDYIMLKVNAFANWGTFGGDWLNYATTTGVLILRPHYAPSFIWADNVSTQAKYSTNSGNANIGQIMKTIYYTNILNNGTQTYFYIYGSDDYIQFNFQSPGVAGGWQYSHMIEYICHSTSGGGITIVDGTGTNNSLP